MCRIGTRRSGWISPGTWILRDAGSDSVVTRSGRAAFIDPPVAPRGDAMKDPENAVREGGRDGMRIEARHRATYELSYASINWIRFEGSPCRAFRALMASQPPAGAPLVIGEKRLRRFSRNISFV